MVPLHVIPQSEFARVRAAELPRYERLALLADMCRANALASVKRAGSGHLGSSFSAMDLVTWLYNEEMNTVQLGFKHPDRDIFFSSKGHDVPGLYSVIHSLGELPEDQLMKLRRLGGTCGHPDVSTPGVEANTGSLGMGVAKGKGMAWAKALAGHGGRVFVMTGDGELQEGQIYETLQTAVNQRIHNLTILVDHNKVQSDKTVDEISSLGDLEAKLKAFGWHVVRCDGHDYAALESVFTQFRSVTDKPKALIADTIKGRGVSFMEHPTALKDNCGLYRWHSGAPDDASFTAAYAELINRINSRLEEAGLAPVTLKEVPPEGLAVANVSLQGEPDSRGNAPVPKPSLKATAEFVAEAFGEALVAIGGRRKDLVVLDADLSADCRLRGFENTYPERFIENGIAEQDMVSMAGGLALQGLLPVVNSFGTFLAARANEQIYNNACERTRILYVSHYAGLIPAGPGQSHQSIRDISLFGALPNVEIIQPCNAQETKWALEHAVEQSRENVMLRLIIGPSPRRIELPEDYRWQFGQGAILTEGNDAVLFAYGPVMLNEALTAAAHLAERGFGLRVINMPWLNRANSEWLREAVQGSGPIYVLEDHAPTGGLGDFLLKELACDKLLPNRPFEILAVEGYPAWGTPPEVLRHHRLDGASLAGRIAAH